VIGFKNKGIYVEVRNQNGDVEKLLSEKRLVAGKWYNVVVRFAYETVDLCDVSLFVNSKFDSSQSVLNFNPFDYISISVGKFRNTKSFNGFVGEFYLFFYPLTQNQIEENYEDGLQEIERGDGYFIQKMLNNDELEHNRQTFAATKNIPDEVLKHVDAAPDLFKEEKEEDPTTSEMNDRVEEVDEAEDDQMSKEQITQSINEYMFDNPLQSNAFTAIASNYEWLLTVSSIMVTGDVSKDGAIELSRFMKILRFCKIKVPRSVIWEIVCLIKANVEIIDDHDDKIKHKALMYYDFLKNLKDSVYGDIMSQYDDEEYEKVSVGHFSDSDDHIEDEVEPEEEEKEEEPEESEKPLATNMRKDSFHSSPGKIHPPKHERDAEDDDDEGEEQQKEESKLIDPEAIPAPQPAISVAENASVNDEGLIAHDQDKDFVVPQEEPEEEVEENVEEEEEAVELDNSLPDFNDEWNNGDFEVNIIRCTECYKHFDYCRHSEDEYVNAFNELGNDIVDKFPDVSVVGNYEKGSYLGCFDVYLRGVGPINKRDNQGRYFLFRKNVAGRFPKARDIQDSLTMLILLYGDAGKVGAAQKEFKSRYSYLIPKPFAKMHEHPADTPEIIKKQPSLTKVVAATTDRVMVCKNWACGQEYNEDKNEKYSCAHHPGVYQFGSRHGLWPESWTCCRAEWEAPGCRRGFHRGVPKENATKLCINHGEPNPDTIYPDSF
jgi:hypothetical protein